MPAACKKFLQLQLGEEQRDGLRKTAQKFLLQQIYQLLVFQILIPISEKGIQKYSPLDILIFLEKDNMQVAEKLTINN